MNLIEELRWRGMFHDMMPGTEEHLSTGQPVTGYIGFDPTAPSLHIGNLATIMLLVHLQRAGHRPVALVGGATGMIGDPSGKSAERNLLDETTLRANQAGIQAQLEKFLDFSEGPTGARVVNNYDWFKEIGFLQFLRDVGKHLTVNYMMAKDSVKRRISGNEESGAEGLSYTEFSYQLLQGYDFFHLYDTLGTTLQMGASDQWGNITTGTELIRRLTNGEGKAFALTGQLITKADGTKYGKSETGTVWLDPTMTSPYQFYQFFLNSADADAPRLIRVFTLLSQEEIEALEAEHAQAPHLRTLQKALAKAVTIRVHSEAAYEAALAASQVLFGGGDLHSLDEPTLLDVFAGVPHLEVERAQLPTLTATDLLSVATNAQVFPSKGEARKMIQQGGVSLNRQKVGAPEQPAADVPLLLDKYLVAQKGKKNYYLLKITD
ncbi:tyrosine--tRNA ligase [Hymenobacter defluvii]|uniref:Tyrosine--tRNA ligase n=1 Tax=Hymenobacter defluvii TaxID=2054411 RepID=A0ABS3T7P8_9BACT|nr:tyrosine--tRNA ligase [Hymenobacter defluvii]MBO3269673.1 tyrosine--tRNA ligase [Hymenobacter defluvii]